MCPQSNGVPRKNPCHDTAGDVHGQKPCDHGGRDWSDRAARQRMLRKAGVPCLASRTGNDKEGMFPRAFRWHVALLTLILNFLPPERWESEFLLV